MTATAFVTATVCALSDTTTWYGFAVSVTSLPCTHPVLPFGRTGRRTSTQPSARWLLTRKTCGTAEPGLPGSYNHGFGSCWVGAGASGDAYTLMVGNVGLTAATNEM